MRFVENGPSIPAELLNARDEGRVVFFCGAGVSRARAGLPDFFGLADSVLRELDALADSDAFKVLNKARELSVSEEISFKGLISADRIFGLLEQDFDVATIRSAVAKCLRPKDNVDRSAHQLLLRLARTHDARTQLVTTNFDKLFDECDERLTVFQPPQLPQLTHHDELNGIVYLHGRVNNDYSGSQGGSFVLSSAEFGHAYLSDGWATDFFREVLRRYVVVFVGYSADDPPVHYLLEGLKRSQDTPRQVYAFQAAESQEAIAHWNHKGVDAIPYAPEEQHRSLWDTLAQWAERADDPRSWRSRVVERAMKGPRELRPHLRGQVAQVISTVDGAREFAEAKPPAEWLCVFDPTCRYASPGPLKRWYQDSPTIDPFHLYGLDSDSFPERGDPESARHKRDIPPEAWDGFAISRIDRLDLSDASFPALRGQHAASLPPLPKRLQFLCKWIANVAMQPAAVWWAARQTSLHPNFRQSIEWALGYRIPEQADRSLLRTWQYLFETWEATHSHAVHEWYELKREIDADGWNLAFVRRFIALALPHLKIQAPILASPVPPQKDVEYRADVA